MRLVKVLQLGNGSEPFSKWVDGLERRTQARIYAYVDRVASGGGKRNVKAIGEGVFEIKVDYGPGYRIYFGEDGKTIILLLLGGDKKSQKKDIQLAKQYWRQYVSK